MARTSVRKAVKKAAAKITARRKSAKKAPVQTRKAVAAKKAAPVRKTAPLKAARKSGRKIVQKTRAPRVVVADGKLVAPPKVSAKERRLALAQQFDLRDDRPDTSMIIVDYQQMRTEAIRAMGGDIASASARDLVQVEGVQVVRDSFATEAKGVALYQKIRANKKGPGTLINAHPLDFHVMIGEDRVNTRDFSTPDMIERVAEMTHDIAVNGIQVSVHAFARDDLLYGLDGETRFRALLHAWIFKARGILPNAPDSVPITLTAKGKNDANIQLDVIKSNQVRNLKPMEIADGILKAFNLGKSVEDIAKYMGQKKSWVDGMLAVKEMPERVQNMIREGSVTIPFAFRVWEQEKHNSSRTTATVEFAVRQAKAQGSTRAMPKHLPPSSTAPAPRKATAKASVEAVPTPTTNDEVISLETGTATVDTGDTTVATTVADNSEAESRAQGESLQAALQESETRRQNTEAENVSLKAAVEDSDAKIARLTKEHDAKVAHLTKENGELTKRAEKAEGRLERVTKHMDKVAGVLANVPLKNPEDGTVGMFPSIEDFLSPVASTFGIDIPDWAKPEESQAA